MECMEAGDNLASAHGLLELPYPASPRRSVDNSKRGAAAGGEAVFDFVVLNILTCNLY